MAATPVYNGVDPRGVWSPEPMDRDECEACVHFGVPLPMKAVELPEAEMAEWIADARAVCADFHAMVARFVEERRQPGQSSGAQAALACIGGLAGPQSIESPSEVS